MRCCLCFDSDSEERACELDRFTAMDVDRDMLWGSKNARRGPGDGRQALTVPLLRPVIAADLAECLDEHHY
jgi:hypothetical protein